MSQTQLVNPACRSSLTEELDGQECQVLSNIMGVRQLHDGELVVTEGDAITTLFALTSGRLSVTSKVDGNDIVVYTMSPGECAGTRAFVDRKPRKATLRAVGETTVYTLEPEAFESLLETHPRIVYKVMRALFRITHANLMHMNMESQALSNYINKSGGRY